LKNSPLWFLSQIDFFIFVTAFFITRSSRVGNMPRPNSSSSTYVLIQRRQWYCRFRSFSRIVLLLAYTDDCLRGSRRRKPRICPDSAPLARRVAELLFLLNVTDLIQIWRSSNSFILSKSTLGNAGLSRWWWRRGGAKTSQSTSFLAVFSLKIK